MSKRRLENDLERFLEHLEYREGFVEVLEDLLVDKYRQRERDIVKMAEDINRHVAELEARKLAAIEKILAVESDLVRRELEKRAENIEREIIDAREQRNQIELTENDIRDFIQFARKLVEKPQNLLLKVEDWSLREALFNLVFDEMPTLDDLRNGTPKLSHVFALSKSFHEGKFQMVGPLAFRWNSLCEAVKQWVKVWRNWKTELKQAS